MNPNQSSPEVQALWGKLERFQIGETAALLDFPARLARENSWTQVYARRVVLEYTKFLLLSQYAGHPVTPSEEVDQAWHLHLVYTRSYWEDLCRDVLRAPLHHQPTAGGPEESARFRQQYQKTLASYERIFGAKPPADIWPDVEARFQPARSRWVDVSRHWVVPRPTWLKLPRLTRSHTAAAVLISMWVLASCTPVMQVLNLAGDAFLRWYVAGFALAFGASAMLVWALKGRSRPVIEPVTDRYDIAFLGGGATRVVDAAVAALFSQGLLKVDASVSGAQLRADVDRKTMPALLHEVEARILRVVPRTHTTSSEALTNLVGPVWKGIQDRLTEVGLLESPARRHFYQGMAALPFLVLMGMGIAKVEVGMTRERPVGLLVLLLVLTVLFVIWRMLKIARRTHAGDRLWADLKVTESKLKSRTDKTLSFGLGDPAQVAMLVALGKLHSSEHAGL